MVPLTDGWFFFPLFWSSVTQSEEYWAYYFYRVVGRKCIPLRGTKTAAGAEVSGDLHWSDTDPGHDTHHYSTLGSLLRDGSLGQTKWWLWRTTPLSTCLVIQWNCWNQACRGSLNTHPWRTALTHILRWRNYRDCQRRENHKFILLDFRIFWTHT